jgi:hypothetical protein
MYPPLSTENKSPPSLTPPMPSLCRRPELKNVPSAHFGNDARFASPRSPRVERPQGPYPDYFRSVVPAAPSPNVAKRTVVPKDTAKDTAAAATGGGELA